MWLAAKLDEFQQLFLKNRQDHPAKVVERYCIVTRSAIGVLFFFGCPLQPFYKCWQLGIHMIEVGKNVTFIICRASLFR